MDEKNVPIISELSEIPDLSQITVPSEDVVKTAQIAQKSVIATAATAASGILKTIELLNKAISVEAIQQMQVVAQAVQKAWESTFSQMASVVSKLYDVISNIKIPTISEEEKKQLLESNLAWGKLGWTYMPSMPFEMFDTPPTSLAEANKLAMQYCNADEMEYLFQELHKRKLNHRDLDSAIFCFKNRQYKACALLLCGLIDSKMIRLQKTDPKKRRDVGSGAVRKMKARYDDGGEKLLSEALFAYNLIAYLETLFGNGNDFKAEPDMLNRNFIGHGMNRRAVRKRDCIQLFLALNNLMHFLDLEN